MKRWFSPALVLALTLKTALGIAGTFDVWFDDETVYLEAGVRDHKPGYLPLADSSPLYPLWYRLLHLVERDRLDLYFFNWFVLTISLPVLLYALARRSGASLASAAIVAVAWSCSGAVMTWPFVSKFAVLVLGLGALAATYVRDRHVAATVTVVALALAAFARAELALAAVALGTLVALSALVHVVVALVRRRGGRARLLASAAIAAGAPFAARALLGDPNSANRSLYAFAQHYALNVVDARKLGVDPWTNWERYFREAFPHANSLGEAIRENPGQVAWHVQRNLGGLIENALAVLRPLAHVPTALAVVVLLTLFVLALLAVGRILFLSARPLDPRFRAWLPLFVAVAVAGGASAVIVFPREHYILCSLWFLQCAIAALCGQVRVPGWSAIARRLVGPSYLRPALVLALPLVAFLAALPTRSGRPPALFASASPPPPAVRENVRTIFALRQLALAGHINILEPDHSRGVYANLDFTRVAQWDKHEPFFALMKNRDVDVVAITDRLRFDPRFTSDPEWKAFEAGTALENEYVRVPVAGTNVVLAVRRRRNPRLP